MDGGTSPGFPQIGKSSIRGFGSVEAMTEAVRSYLRDFAPDNRLLRGFETEDNMIRLFLALTLDDFNKTPPITSYGVENFPSYYLLVLGTVINVMRAAGIKYSRNRLNYNEAGVSVASSDQAGDYQSWISSFFNEYERKKRELKISINIRGAFGSMPSEYLFFDRNFFF